jgi:hypothetical protein
MLDNMRIAVSPELAIQRRRAEAMRTPGGDVFTAAQGDIVSGLGPQKRTGLLEERHQQIMAARKFEQQMDTPALIKALGGPPGSVQQVQRERAEFRDAHFSGTFVIEVGGDRIPAALKNAAQHDRARGLGTR